MPTEHLVQPGECLASIAFEHGFLPETLWRDPANAGLRSQRKNLCLLVPGDKVFIPDPSLEGNRQPAGKRCVFRRKAVPEKLRIRLLDAEAKPRANLVYRLTIEGVLRKGRTNPEGLLEEPIPPGARKGILTLGEGDTEEEYLLRLGRLQPVSELAGVQARLNNLGCPCGAEDGVLNAATRNALKAFQADQKLPVTGDPDATTRNKLAELHRS
jgi:hypothetical protein